MHQLMPVRALNASGLCLVMRLVRVPSTDASVTASEKIDRTTKDLENEKERK